MTDRENPFKYGTVVDGEFFTDRTEELPLVRQMLSGRNHLVVISPRRYGKTSLVRKAVEQTKRPAVFANVQMAFSSSALAEMLLRSFLAIHPWERFKDALKKFRTKPVISYSLESNGIDVSFESAAQGKAALEDVLQLMEEKSDEDKRLIVVLDEFQAIADLEPGTDKLLRGIMQLHKNINYVFLGSEESMMTTIFEDIKSPFFHFGALLRLERIPYDDFRFFLLDRLEPIRGRNAAADAEKILELTHCHPFYTQQLAAVFWDMCQRRDREASVEGAAEVILRGLSPSYSFVWSKLGLSARRTLETLARGAKLSEIRDCPTSTVYSAVAKLKKDGIIVRSESYELEDPFFGLWIRQSMQQATIGLQGQNEFKTDAPE